MKTIRVRNVHDALPEALHQLRLSGVDVNTRNGAARAFPAPVTTTYTSPQERVIFWAERDANPFFHLFESLWMLAGRNDVEFPARFVDSMRRFSDDGKVFHGAYGERWSHHFGFNQVRHVIRMLKEDPETRRAVIGIWDATDDLGNNSKDLPCNIAVAFRVRPNGHLDMTVYNRSNDIVWGAYGANAVHFSYLHELVAVASGYPMGAYHQVSNDLHAYTDTLAQVADVAGYAQDSFLPRNLRIQANPYASGAVRPYPLMQPGTDFDEWSFDLYEFLTSPERQGFVYFDPFFSHVAAPMYTAWHIWKSRDDFGRFKDAKEVLKTVAATDWALAATEWLTRRELKAKAKAADDGVNYDVA